MTKKRSILGYTIFFIVVAILIFFSNYSNVRNCIQANRELSFNGHILRKYIDKIEHLDRIIEVTSKEDKIQKIDLSLDHSGLFDYVQTNDSIIKLSGSLNVMVYRNSVDTIIVLNKKCIGF